MPGTFYCFVTPGSAPLPAGLCEHLQRQYEGGSDMSLAVVGPGDWPCPSPGAVDALGRPADLNPYLMALVNSLITRYGCTREQTEKAALLTRNRGLTLASGDALVIGVPVEAEAPAVAPMDAPAYAPQAITPQAYAPPVYPVAGPAMTPPPPVMPVAPAKPVKKPNILVPLSSFGVTLILFLINLENMADMWYLYLMFLAWDIASLIGYFNQRRSYSKLEAMSAAAPAQAAASAPLAVPAMISLQRQSSAVGAVVSYKVYLNGQYVGDIRNGGRLDFPSGTARNTVSLFDQYGNAFALDAVFDVMAGGRAEITCKAGKLLADQTRVYPA